MVQLGDLRLPYLSQKVNEINYLIFSRISNSAVAENILLHWQKICVLLYSIYLLSLEKQQKVNSSRFFLKSSTRKAICPQASDKIDDFV